MRVTVLPWADILTKAHRAAVSMMAKGCIIIRRPASALSEKLLCPPGPWGPAAVG